jgi:predicted TIM-barrel enzyme
MNVHAARHVVVIAGDRVPASDLASALARRAEAGSIRVTVVCPVSEPAGGLVVYEDSRRDAARVRLELALDAVPGIVGSARGLIVEAGVEDAARDACAQFAPDELLVCADLPRRPFGGGAAQRLERVTGVPVEVIGGDCTPPAGGVQSVLAVASGPIPGTALIGRIRVRSRMSAARFTIACPAEAHHPRLLELAVDLIRDSGVDARAHLAHPNACVAALHAVQEGLVDEIIVAVDPMTPRRRRARPDWIARATGLPVDAVFEGAALEEAA